MDDLIRKLVAYADERATTDAYHMLLAYRAGDATHAADIRRMLTAAGVDDPAEVLQGMIEIVGNE